MWKYLLTYSVPLAVFLSLRGEGWQTYLALIYLFGLVPFLELIFQGSTENLDEEAENKEANNKMYDWILYSLVPMQYLLGYYFLQQMADPSILWWERMGMIVAFGLSCGILGINAAHELGHRTKAYERWMSKILLASTLYLHFFIEHNKGHHLRVATPDDPASARRGENVYAFYLRSIRDSWFSAWEIQNKELKKTGHRFWSLQNEMLLFQIVQVLICVAIGLVWGYVVLIWYFVAAVIGIHLLETVNYIEHYGLQRKVGASGFFERTMPVHSWNSNHPLGRMVLLELTRHSDHHYQATRKYQVLRHFDESPQMPTGYPGMMLLSLIPPLWFAVMHKAIQDYKNNYQQGVDLV